MTLTDTHSLIGAARAANSINQAATGDQSRRILMVQTQAENAGAQEISRILGEGLEARGHDVHQTFFFRRTASFDQTEKTSFCADSRPSSPLQLIRMMWRLYRLMRELKPDTVLCFQHYGNIIAAPIARLAGVRHIIANRVSAVETMPDWLQKIDRVSGTLGLFSKVVVNSANVENEYGAYPASYRRRLARIDHGFKPKVSSLTRAQSRAKFGLPANAVILGSVARLHPLKNLQAAVRLLPKHPERHLALVGQGQDEEQLRALADELGCRDRVHFIGEVQPQGVADFLAGLDLFAFPTLAETFGLAAVEAAQAGIPVLANDLPVLHEVLQVNGHPCAILADATDPDTFAAAADSVLDNASLASKLSLRGRQLAAKYSLDAMVDSYEEMLKLQ